MREQLNNNPLAQVVLVGVLLVVAGVFFMSSTGGGESESGSSTTTSTATATTPDGSASVTATVTAPTGTAAVTPALTPGQAAAAAPPLPRPVTDAWAANRTVVLLFVRNGGIDDRLVAATVNRLRGLPGVSAFVIPAGRISRYAAIAQGVEISRVPALVVLRPKDVDRGGIPTASVSYGFQSPEAVVQEVVDAGYKGRTVPYHP